MVRDAGFAGPHHEANGPLKQAARSAAGASRIRVGLVGSTPVTTSQPPSPESVSFSFRASCARLVGSNAFAKTPRDCWLAPLTFLRESSRRWNHARGTMRQSHESFIQPPDTSIKVWRYSDLSKFVALLQDSRIYFSRADVLGDPFEGSITQANHMQREALRLLRAHPELKDKYANSLAYVHTDDDKFEAMLKQFGESNQRLMRTFFVSCWHMNEHESAAMWSVYGDQSSICIQSTYAKLDECLPESINLGKVRYIDYGIDVIDQTNVFNNIMHKRKSFSHEQEARAVYWDGLAPELQDANRTEQAGASGVKISVDLNSLVERIFIVLRRRSGLRHLSKI